MASNSIWKFMQLKREQPSSLRIQIQHKMSGTYALYKSNIFLLNCDTFLWPPVTELVLIHFFENLNSFFIFSQYIFIWGKKSNLTKKIKILNKNSKAQEFREKHWRIIYKKVYVYYGSHMHKLCFTCLRHILGWRIQCL